MKYLPSKKLIFSAIIAFVLIGGAFWVAGRSNTYTNTDANRKITEQLPAEGQFKKLIETNKDSDGDGLKDWEEVLWRTNPNKIDTDGDGTLDGKEIEENRNPTIAGPNDSLSLSAGRKTATGPEENLTLTDKIGREFLTNYLSFKSAGDKLDPYTKKELVNGMVSDLQTQKLENTYALKDISIIRNNNRETIEIYASDLEKIFEKQFNTLKENELDIVQQAVKFNIEKPEALGKLKPYELAYKNAVKELLKMKVPQSYAEIHLNFINSLAKVEKSVIAFQKLFIDPAQSVQGLKWYQEEKTALAKNFIDLRDKLITDGVKPGEGNIGYIFVYYKK